MRRPCLMAWILSFALMPVVSRLEVNMHGIPHLPPIRLGRSRVLAQGKLKQLWRTLGWSAKKQPRILLLRFAEFQDDNLALVRA